MPFNILELIADEHNQVHAKQQIREISLRNRPEELYKVSQKGTVPVLITQDNQVIDESLDIMIWGIQHSQLDFLKENSQKQLDMIKMNFHDK